MLNPSIRPSLTADPWRYDPVGPREFAPGAGPFRVRGHAFRTALDYIDQRLAGGRAAFLRALGRPDVAPYYDQIFVAAGDYDVAPLVLLYCTAARLKGVSTGRFIEARSRWSASSVVQGLWKPVLKTRSPEAMAERVHYAFNRFFEPSRARSLHVSTGLLEVELSIIPSHMNGIYTSSTVGFVEAALELAGARDARLEFASPEQGGALEGVPLDRFRFAATWKPPQD